MNCRVAAFGTFALLCAAVAFAHVTVSPRETRAGATETYAMRVPTEGQLATTSVELEVPDGVTIVSVSGGSNVQQKKAGDRVTAIVWTVDIPPGQNQEFTFVAKNPPSGVEIVWRAHQRFADGTTTDWVEPAGGRRPASITKLIAP